MAKQPTKAAPVAKNSNAPARQTEPEAETTTTAIAAAAGSAIAVSGSMPAWLAKKMEGQAPRGLEKMDNADLIIPRIVLAQALSPDVANGIVPVGCLFDNISKEILAPKGEALEFIPIALAKQRIYFKPIAEGGGMLCRADDALTARPGGLGKDQGGNETRSCVDCIFKEWSDEGADPKDNKPKCTLLYNIVGLLPSRGYLPYVLSGKSTNVKVFKRFLSSAKQTGADLFGLKYDFHSVADTSGNFKFFNFDFKPLGWVNEEEYKKSEAFYKTLGVKTWAPDTSDLAEEVEAQVNPVPAAATAQQQPGDDAF